MTATQLRHRRYLKQTRLTLAIAEAVGPSPGNGPHFTFVGERRASHRGARLPTRKPGLASVEPAAANTERNVLRNVALQAPSLTGELGLK